MVEPIWLWMGALGSLAFTLSAGPRVVRDINDKRWIMVMIDAIALTGWASAIYHLIAGAVA